MQEGSYKGEIVVEVNSLNKPFNGTIRPKEAKVLIFHSGGQIVTYKLKKQLDIDTLGSVINYS
jgi:hypothetical protein